MSGEIIGFILLLLLIGLIAGFLVWGIPYLTKEKTTEEPSKKEEPKKEEPKKEEPKKEESKQGENNCLCKKIDDKKCECTKGKKTCLLKPIDGKCKCDTSDSSILLDGTCKFD